MTNPPYVSVIMAVKDGEKYVQDSIESVLTQTFSNFEFLIINDGSTDGTLEILNQYKDKRIKIFSQENQGLSRSLNLGLKHASGKYIARQDHDDISLPDRLKIQVDYLDSNISCGLVGSHAQIWEGDDFKGRMHQHPTDPDILKFELLFNNPFVHSSWMFRRSLIAEIGFYSEDPTREPPEDYEYVSRISRSYEVANIPEILVIYREVKSSISSVIRQEPSNRQDRFRNNLVTISSENIAIANRLITPDAACRDFGRLVHLGIVDNTSFTTIIKINQLLVKAAKNIKSKYGHNSLKKELCDKQNSLYSKFYYFKYKSSSSYLKLIFWGLYFYYSLRRRTT